MCDIALLSGVRFCFILILLDLFLSQNVHRVLTHIKYDWEALLRLAQTSHRGYFDTLSLSPTRSYNPMLESYRNRPQQTGNECWGRSMILFFTYRK